MKQVKNVHQQIPALVWKEDNLYVAKAVEVEIASQGKTKNEALVNLKEALELYFEDEPKLLIKPSYKNLSLEKIAFQYV